MLFEFATAGRILFGDTSIREIGPLAKAVGRKPFLLTGSRQDRAAPVMSSLSAAGLVPQTYSVAAEPTFATVTEAVEIARLSDCDCVIACGGGSVIDTGKAVAAIMTNGGTALDYAELIGAGQTFERSSQPLFAVPTTAGAGAEATGHAMFVSPGHQLKVSLRSCHLLPRFSIVDPELSWSLPPVVTAATGFGALTHLIEAFLSRGGSPMTDVICRDGLRLAAAALPRAYENGLDAEARRDMALAALFGGIALANAGLGAAHGFATAIGGAFDAPHGSLCARLLPEVLAINLRAVTSRDSGNRRHSRFEEMARILTGNPAASAQEGILWIHDLRSRLEIRSLSAYGVMPADFPVFIAKARASGFM
ncbi:MAG TPA: iron-containing alcohol dehydrogenase, partial [Candidatus Ozemobacteraceae bacterium]|nr:iron-containing alcohol dehydrogenase [Candidatus Ozemobacteraceae bacterium]